MKTYSKPVIEIIAFHADENIAAGSVFDYTDGSAVPVSLFGIQENSWNEGTGVS